MKLLGFSTQKLLYKARQQDPVLVRQQEVETYPATKAAAHAEGATIYFADEAQVPMQMADVLANLIGAEYVFVFKELKSETEESNTVADRQEAAIKG